MMESTLKKFMMILIILTAAFLFLNMALAGRGDAVSSDGFVISSAVQPASAPVVSEGLVRHLIQMHMATLALFACWSLGALLLFVGVVWGIIRVLGRSEHVERSVYVVREVGVDSPMLSYPSYRNALPGPDHGFYDLRTGSSKYLEG